MAGWNCTNETPIFSLFPSWMILIAYTTTLWSCLIEPRYTSIAFLLDSTGLLNSAIYIFKHEIIAIIPFYQHVFICTCVVAVLRLGIRCGYRWWARCRHSGERAPKQRRPDEVFRRNKTNILPAAKRVIQLTGLWRLVPVCLSPESSLRAAVSRVRERLLRTSLMR